ncbi:uncharacterized protein BN660_01006 [Clostridium sp. CAG:448]|nr:uncharacterized protein BN660_01006 [Clostridium sp. CAG:448]
MVQTIPRPEYPRPQMRRDAWCNLNGEWLFEEDPACSGKARGLAADTLPNLRRIPCRRERLRFRFAGKVSFPVSETPIFANVCGIAARLYARRGGLTVISGSFFISAHATIGQPFGLTGRSFRRTAADMYLFPMTLRMR